MDAMTDITYCKSLAFEAVQTTNDLRFTATPTKWLPSLFLMLLGSSCIFFAVALWLVPGSSLEKDVMLFKAGLTITASLVGAILIRASRETRTDKIKTNNETSVDDNQLQI